MATVMYGKMVPVQTKLIAALTLSMLIGLIFFACSVASEMDCAKISHWSATNPPINQQHVFCGEWNKRKNRPAGFHSRPAGENPATVGTLKITQQPDAKGIYGVRWSSTRDARNSSTCSGAGLAAPRPRRATSPRRALTSRSRTT